MFEKIEENICKARTTSPWVLRLVFDKEKMNTFGLKMIDIYTKLKTSYDKYIDCIYGKTIISCAISGYRQ